MYFTGTNIVSQTSLTTPLVSATSTNEGFEAAYDEESQHERWFKSTSSIGDDDSPSGKLSSKYRVHRKLLAIIFSKPGGIINLIMFLTYLFTVGLIIAAQINPSKVEAYYYAGMGGYIIWLIATGIPNFAYLWGGRQSYAWGGLYVDILFTLLQAATLTLFIIAFQQEIDASLHLDRYLLVLMAATIYVDQQIVKPSFRKLHWFYLGAISKEEARAKPLPIARISNEILQKVAKNACKATKVSDEAAKTIEKLLVGQRIRKDKEEAVDDWTLAIKMITKAVSFAPFSICRSKSAITSTQCRNLVCQMVIYLRRYMNEGHIEADETDLHRTAPLSFGEALWAMVKLSFQVPLSFIVALIPRSVFGVVGAAVLPKYLEDFGNGLMLQDFELARDAFIKIFIISVIIPFVNILSNAVESSFTTKMVDQCRRKMLRSTVKGGTKFDEKNRPGTLNDAFTNQLNMLEVYCVQFYIQFVPQIFAVAAAIVKSSQIYPFAVVLFLSLLPVVFACDYFTERASNAASKAVKNDAIFAGKIGSAIACRKAIRASDASEYIKTDMDSFLVATKDTHFSKFFRSFLTHNFIEVAGLLFNQAVLFPVGLHVLDGKMLLGSYLAISTSMTFLMMPLNTLGMATSQTLQYSGAIQTVMNLMEDKLDEEPSSDKSSRFNIALPSLKNSITLSGIKFRYTPQQSDVVNDVDASIDKGTYNVICGESGSGKTTVLNLLMRFREPYQGSIKWDGTDIFGTTLQSFRKNVSVMFQETMIYQTTIRENITFGLPEVPGAVEKAARDAEIAHVIERLPDRYDTVIGGDSLTGLSGGQLQRICMARALYKKPSLLLLDEATSALDAETEASIIDTLVKLRDENGVTLVSVSHHPSTAVKADKIVVMRAGGTIAEEGVYSELVSREGGIFKRMVESGE